MAALKMTLEGDKEMKANLEGLVAGFPLEARRAMNAILERKVVIVQGRTPVKSGNLKATIRKSVSLAKARGAPNISGTIIAGGGPKKVAYARMVHENLKARHRVGQAKYLESVLLEAVPTVGGELATEIELKKAMRKSA
jgi:hypothetical protein